MCMAANSTQQYRHVEVPYKLSDKSVNKKKRLSVKTLFKPFIGS